MNIVEMFIDHKIYGSEYGPEINQNFEPFCNQNSNIKIVIYTLSSLFFLTICFLKLMFSSYGLKLILKLFPNILKMTLGIVLNNFDWIMPLIKKMIPMEDNKTVIKTSGKIMTIDYTLDDKNFKLILPYDRKNRASAINKIINIRHADGRNEVINHPPGVPFLVTPSDINDETLIEITDLISGQTEKIINNEIIKL